MASKKDKLTKKIQEEVKKNLPTSSEGIDSYGKVIQEIQNKKMEESQFKTNQSNMNSQSSLEEENKEFLEQNRTTEQKEKFHEFKKNQDNTMNDEKSENMSTKRDSIYNVSADLRLEDYIEDKQKKDYGPIIRNLSIILLILLLIIGIWKLGVYLFAPKYYLSISNTEITEENFKSFIDNYKITLYAGQLLHIRFTYLEKNSDYYTIQILKEEAGNLIEEAVLGRKVPKTVNYIYFAGPVDPGIYIVKVFDRERNQIIERKIEIVSP